MQNQHSGAKAPKPAHPAGKKRKKKEKYCWWAGPVIGLSLVVLAVAGLVVSQQVNAYSRYRQMRGAVEGRTYYEGIYVDRIALANATLEQALEHWRNTVEPGFSQRAVTVTVDGQSYTLKAAELGYSSNYEDVLRQAYGLGRSGSLQERYAQVQQLRRETTELPVERALVDERKVRARVAEIAAQVNAGATDAHVTGFNPDTCQFSFAEGQAGYAVDQAALERDVLAAFAAGGGTVTGQVTLVQPTTTAAALSTQYGKIDSAITNASSSSANRLSNIQLACSTINGFCLQPGETFSFNEVLGKRTRDKGYKPAPAFVNGLVEEDVGGGICQVSTTLFNAIVKADMTIVERNPHSRPVSYVDKGKDAAVNWPDTDMKFRNDTDSPIYIVAEVTEKKRVQISVYGKLFADGGSIVIEAKVTEELEPGNPEYRVNTSLAPGQTMVVQDPRTGYKAEAYKVYLDANGKEVRRELLCRSTYRPSGGIYEYAP